MFHTYFKTALRSLLRNKQHAVLNIAGLAISIAVCLIIFLVVKHETSYNKYLGEYSKLYHFVTNERFENTESLTSGVPFPTIKYLKKDYDRFRFGEMMQFTGTQVSVMPGSTRSALQKFYEEAPVCYMDSVMANFLEIKIISGDDGLFRNHDKVAISRSTAEKYFGDYKAAVGNMININTQLPDIEVGAVFENTPVTSDFPVILIASYEYFRKNNSDGWNLDNWENLSSNHQLYVRIPDEAQVKPFQNYLENFYSKYHPKGDENKNELSIRPFSSIHFDENVESNGDHITSWTSIYTLALVGLLILFMACINFINLSTALAFSRSKEIGVRKVLGSNKGSIRAQLFSETTIVVMISMVIAMAMASLAVPYIKHLLVTQADLSVFTPVSVGFTLLLGLVTIFLAGTYPAFILSRFSPVSALKNAFSTPGKAGVITRKGLVVIQFAVSQMLLIATVVTIQQMQYVKKADLGFNKEAIINLVIANDSANAAKLNSFKQTLLLRPDIESVSFAFDAPSSTNSWSTNFAFDVMEDKPYEVNLKFGQSDYFKTYGLEFVSGKPYPDTDTVNSYVVNESFARKEGFQNPEDVIGKMLRLGNNQAKPVIGVVRDFNQATLRETVKPIVILPLKKVYSLAGIKLNSRNLINSRAGIKQIWDGFFPDIVFQSNFYNEDIEAYYQQDIRLSRMYRFCALLAILISCLGLYGLISFTIIQKTKEVGVRKVLGASVSQIVYLFSKEFILLVGIAFALAGPVSYFFIQQWLQGFAYRISISPLVFIVAIIFSLLTAFLAVGIKSYHAAVVNPVKSLRTE